MSILFNTSLFLLLSDFTLINISLTVLCASRAAVCGLKNNIHPGKVMVATWGKTLCLFLTAYVITNFSFNVNI